MADRKRTGVVCAFHEFMFSLSIAFAVVWGHSSTSLHFSLLERAKQLFPPHVASSDNDAAGYPAFFLLVAAITVLIFLTLHFSLSKWTWKGPLLLWLGGMVAALAMPGCWFYIIAKLGLLGVKPNAFWFLAEGGVVVVFVVLYASQRWRVADLPAAGLLSLHYAFWSWFFWEYLPPNMLRWVLPAVGACAGLAWVRSVRHRRDIDNEQSVSTMRPQER